MGQIVAVNEDGSLNSDQNPAQRGSIVVVYATGGAVEATDQRQITEIVARARAKNYGFRTLIHEVIESDLFKNK